MTCNSWKIIALITFLCGAGFAQTFDTSGDSGVSGPYFVRHVLTADLDQETSAIGRATSLTGIMTFNGSGSYSFSGQMMDTQTGSSAYTVSGTYRVSSSGLIQLTNPIDATDVVYGGVGALGPSAIVGSSTEGTNNDIFIAVPAGTNDTNSSIQGTFVAGFIDFLQANAAQARNGYFALNSNGSGSFGTVSVNGKMANLESKPVTQNFPGVIYNVSGANGSGTLTFPTASSPLNTLLSGQKTLYVSSDGNILIGADPGGFDILVAIKGNTSPVSNTSFQGTYFGAALEDFEYAAEDGLGSIDAYWGSTLGLGQGAGIMHQRYTSFVPGSQADYTFSVPEDFSLGANSSAGLYQNLLAANGQAVLQIGIGPIFGPNMLYSLVVNLQAKAKTSSGVFIKPLGVLNAASYAPITNPVAPGEFVSIFGSGLATGVFTPSSLPLLTKLGGVSVTVNNRLAPLSYVSPTQINILMPIATSENFATFQVTNNGVVSNAVALYNRYAAPGIFTGSPSGIGLAAVLHADFSPVTQASPALAGETVLLYATGLGAVTPVIADGVAAPSSPLSTVDRGGVAVNLADQVGKGGLAAVAFSGLAPGFAGLYQINFKVPSGLTAGPVTIVISAAGSYTSEAITYLGATSANDVLIAVEPITRSAAR
jgi:uncharacterized protein (TIGR03437 family)